MPWTHPKPTAPTSDEGEDAETKAAEADLGTEEGNGAAAVATVPEEIGADRLWLCVHVPPSVLTGDSWKGTHHAFEGKVPMEFLPIEAHCWQGTGARRGAFAIERSGAWL